MKNILRDLINDIRCARRDGHPSIELRHLTDLRTLITKRHSTKIDAFGWPDCLGPIGWDAMLVS